jgi:hypothetical protein
VYAIHTISSIDLTDGLTKNKAYVVLKPGKQTTDAELNAFVKHAGIAVQMPTTNRIRQRSAEDSDRNDSEI